VAPRKSKSNHNPAPNQPLNPPPMPSPSVSAARAASDAAGTDAVPGELEAAKWDITDEMTQTLIDRWAEATADVPPETPHVPLLTLLGEAIVLASFVEQHLSPVTMKGTRLPGLDSVAGTGNVSQKTPEELRELAMALGAVRAQIDRLVQSGDRESIEEGADVLAELKATLRFVLEDDETGEAQLDQLTELYGSADSFDEMAMALQAFADLADAHRDAVAAVSTFAAGLPARARGLSFALRERKALQLGGPEARQVALYKDIRDRLTGALLLRMRSARKAFRFVFRDYPDIVRKVTSAYERDRRRTRDRNADGNAPSDTDTTQASAPSAMGV